MKLWKIIQLERLDQLGKQTNVVTGEQASKDEWAKLLNMVTSIDSESHGPGSMRQQRLHNLQTH